MKVILVPTDFSLAADNALNYAIPVAIKEAAKIVLVHAFNIDPMYTTRAFPGRLIEYEIIHAEERAKYHLRGKCESIKSEHNVVCEYISGFDFPVNFIKQAVKRFSPQMIIMGTNGASSLSEKILGSTTARIIGKADCPVIAIPASAKYHGVQKIAYALDFSQNDSNTFRKIKRLNSLFSAHVSVIHICKPQDADSHKTQLAQLKKKAEKEVGGNISYRIIQASGIGDELMKIAKNKRYDILVMVTHTRSFIESLFDSSETKRVSNSIRIPLLAFK